MTYPPNSQIQFPQGAQHIFILKFIPVGTIQLPRRNTGKYHIFRSQEVFYCTLTNGFFRVFESRLLSFSHIAFLEPRGRARVPERVVPPWLFPSDVSSVRGLRGRDGHQRK